MGEFFATTALETLRDLLLEETRFLARVGSQVEDVSMQLNQMHAFLRDADRSKDRWKSDSSQELLRQLQNLAIEAEQLLEIYGVQVTSKRQRKDVISLLKRFGCILGECVSMHKAGRQAERIISQMADLTIKMKDSMPAGGSSSNAGDGQVELWRKTYGHEVEEHFVGMKGDIDRLTSLVKSDDRSSRVITIWGMGGLGKTTLARKIYQDKEVQRHFEAKAWICVSQQRRPKAIFQELLQMLSSNTSQVENLSENALVEKLYNIQKEKKCLVILDDVWEAEHWSNLSHCFPIAESSSKVLITSRYQDVAVTECVQELRLLSQDEGWELLQRIALPISDSQANLSKMEEIGSEIVRKCGFLPLAISVIGGILRWEKNWRDWEKVCRSVDSYLQHGKGIEKYGRVNQVLELSYDALPYNLKPCFLSLGCFEEDEEIDVEQLCLIWMAEGFISSEDKGRGETLRDVAEHYLHDLASRCMVQTTLDEKLAYRSYSSCRLHDLVRELCLLKAKEEGFFRVADKHGDSDDSLIDKVNRLMVYNWDDGNKHIWKNSNLRGLLIRRGEDVIMGKLEKFKYLKFLILEELNFKDGKLPKGINKLVLLKHLRIYKCNLDTLPQAICELPYLQSMHLERLSLLQMPSSIHRMRHLTYLCLDEIEERTVVGGRKLKLCGLNKLETLIGFNSRQHDTSDLIELKNLRVFKGIIYEEESICIIVDHISYQQKQFSNIYLEIECNIDSKKGFALISKMLSCEPICQLMLDGMRLKNLPAYTPTLGLNLVTLHLCRCAMVEDPMETLGKLPVLRALALDQDAFVGTEMICKIGGFSQLKSLLLFGLRNLVNWRIEENAMSQLSDLCIWECSMLEMIPDGVRFITSLTLLNVVFMSSTFKSRIIEGGADYNKIKHIPNVLA